MRQQIRRAPGTATRFASTLALAVLFALAACTSTRRSAPSARPVAATAPVRDGAGATVRGRPEPPTRREVAILAGGCFWGMQELLRAIPGVLETEVGYTGGGTDRPGYDTVHTGATGHAEAVRVVFDPAQLSYETLLERWFFRMHDPTTRDRQGNDVGSQYRSAIFYTTDEQRRVAEAVRARVDRSGHWRAPVVTQIAPAGPFTRAEDEHQDYLQRNPGGYTCHYLREWT